jgi:hypothetical protein
LPRYDQYLTTLTAYKRKRGIAETTDDTLLTELIEQSSSWFANRCQRSFVPYTMTRSFDRYGMHLHGYKLDLDEDLLAVTTLTASGTVITSDDYVLQDANATPYWQIQLLASTGATWGTPTELINAISVDGIWGYHRNYANAWKSRSALAEDLDSSETDVDVTASHGSRFEVLQYLQIGSEQMLITGISTDTLTVERGVNGTTAASHSTSDAVKTYQLNRDVQQAVNRLVDFFYDHRDTFNKVIQTADGKDRLDDLIPPDVMAAVYNHERQWTAVLG